jgi:uncharacterized protein (DUF1501 family)
MSKNDWDRRSFLRGAGLTLAGFGSASLLSGSWARHAAASGKSSDFRLLLVFLRGGNDGLNALIPHGDPDYSAANRPSLYVPPRDSVDLGNGFASLHPSLGAMIGSFKTGDLAVIHRVGYPGVSRSHLAGRRILENGDPARPDRAGGWIDRCLRMSNACSTGAVEELGEASRWNPTDPNDGRPLFPTSDPKGELPPEAQRFFRELKLGALSLLEGGRVAVAELDGWDTHEAQGGARGRHAQLLSWLAHGFRSLRVVLSGAATNESRGYASIWNKTVVATMSEFGRTTMENEFGGTDHASANCMFMGGGKVKGGVYNCDGGTWPAGVMFGVDGRYLLHRTDYRAVLWEIMRDHMGADPAGVDTVFPSYTALRLGSQELGLI